MQEELTAAGFDPEAVQMREIETAVDAERERFVGSPTIRIGGEEVAPAENEASGLTCRVYRLRDGRVSPTPDPSDIRDAIRRSTT